MRGAPIRFPDRPLGPVCDDAAVRLALALACALAFAAVAPAAGPAPAPALAGVDLVTGKRIALADFRGRVVVVNVWGSWCHGCVTEARELARFVRRHPSVAVLGIDSEDSRAAARVFYRRFGLRHPSIFDPRGALARRLGLTGLPTTLFLDRRHRVVGAVVGAGTLASFERQLRIARSA
jgi:thiol-disulfide isomerase/thioredoxin